MPQEPKPTQAEAPPQPAPPGATPPGPDLLSDLTADALPPASGETPPTPEPAAPAPKEPTSPAEPGKKEPAPTPPKPPRYKIGDREYSVEDLVQSGRLDDLLITYGKHQSLTQKHEEVRQQLDDLQRKALDAAKPPERAEEPRPALRPEQVQAAYAPVLAEEIKQGWLEPDVAELYPKTTATVRYHIDRLNGMVQAIEGLAQRFYAVENKVLGVSPEDVFGRLDKDLDALAGDAERKEFGVLKEKAVRDGFVEFIKALDPRVKQIQDPEFLRRQFYAYNNDAIQEAMRQAAASSEQDPKRRAQAAGEGRPGGRPPAPAPVEKTHLEELTEEFLPPQRR